MKILYSGIGSKKDGIHTISEFLEIMKKEFTHRVWRFELNIIPKEYHYQLQYNNWNLPDDFVFFELNDWIDYSGAEVLEDT
jgi:hypothetical protein